MSIQEIVDTMRTENKRLRRNHSAQLKQVPGQARFKSNSRSAERAAMAASMR